MKKPARIPELLAGPDSGVHRRDAAACPHQGSMQLIFMGFLLLDEIGPDNSSGLKFQAWLIVAKRIHIF